MKIIKLKKLIGLMVALGFIGLAAHAQTPQGVNYQAVARDGAGALLKNKSISVKAIILSGASASNVEYTETHSVTTNDYGLFNLIIGDGSSTGSFGAISWGTKKHHLKIEIDNGSGFVSMGTMAFQSVPYALSAKSVENMPTLQLSDLSDVSTTGVSNGQVLAWDGTSWKPTTVGGGGTTYTAGNGISINANVIEATSNSPIWNANKLQNRSIASSAPSNGQVLKWNGTSWSPSADAVNTYSAGTGLTLTTGVFSANNTTASWNANQLQGRTIATTAPKKDEILKWDGTSWKPSLVKESPWESIGTTYIHTKKRVGIGRDSARTRFDILDTITGSGNANFATTLTEMEGSTSNLSTSFASWIRVNGRGGYENIGLRSLVTGTSTATYQGSGAVAGYFYASGSTGQNNFSVEGLTAFENSATARNYSIYAHSRGDGTFNMGVFALSNRSHNSTTKTNYGIYAQADSARTNYAGYFVGNVTYTGLLSSASDARLKSDIAPLNGALGKVMDLKVKSYNYKQDGLYGKMNLPEGKQFGFLAQELEQTFPELVDDQVHAINAENNKQEVESFEYKAVNYIGMIPVLTKAIQEQQEYIKLLEQRIKALENAK